jgi:hypothetical protein
MPNLHSIEPRIKVYPEPEPEPEPQPVIVLLFSFGQPTTFPRTRCFFFPTQRIVAMVAARLG